MWIMALGAFPFLYRWMDNLLPGHWFVAPATKCRHVAYRLEGMFAGRRMTGSTLTHRHGPMNELILPHGGVTCFGNTGVSLSISFGKSAFIITVRQNEEQNYGNDNRK